MVSKTISQGSSPWVPVFYFKLAWRNLADAGGLEPLGISHAGSSPAAGISYLMALWWNRFNTSASQAEDCEFDPR